MTTQEVATKYYELACQAKWLEIQQAFHHDDVVCLEPEHAVARGVATVTKGKQAVLDRGTAFRETIEAIHSQYCSEPIVTDGFFSVALKRDITFKNRPRVQMEEIAVIQVQDGKIISEQFFY